MREIIITGHVVVEMNFSILLPMDVIVQIADRGKRGFKIVNNNYE